MGAVLELDQDDQQFVTAVLGQADHVVDDLYALSSTIKHEQGRALLRQFLRWPQTLKDPW